MKIKRDERYFSFLLFFTLLSYEFVGYKEIKCDLKREENDQPRYKLLNIIMCITILSTSCPCQVAVIVYLGLAPIFDQNLISFAGLCLTILIL